MCDKLKIKMFFILIVWASVMILIDFAHAAFSVNSVDNPASVASVTSPASVNTVVGAVAFCDSCPDAAGGADLICEDFEGTGYTCTGWAETIGTDNTFDEDATPASGFSCTETNIETLEYKIDESVTGDEDAYAVKAIAASNNVYAKTYYVLTSDLTMNAGNEFGIIGFFNGISVEVQVQIEAQGSGDYKIAVIYRDSSALQFPGSANSSVVFNEDQHIKIDLEWIRNTSVKVWVNDDLELEVCASGCVITETAADKDIDNIYLGSTDAQAAVSAPDIVISQIANTKIDDDTMPPDCEGWTP